MSENISNIEAKKSTEKSFGYVFSFIFFLVSLYLFFTSRGLYIWAILISLIFLMAALFYPKALNIPNELWFKFGIFLGSIIAPIIMMLVFFIVVAPTGIIMRLLGKDLLKQKLDNSVESYWEKREQKVGSMKNQF
jgi:hypothetical protein